MAITMDIMFMILPYSGMSLNPNIVVIIVMALRIKAITKPAIITRLVLLIERTSIPSTYYRIDVVPSLLQRYQGLHRQRYAYQR